MNARLWGLGAQRLDFVRSECQGSCTSTFCGASGRQGRRAATLRAARGTKGGQGAHMITVQSSTQTLLLATQIACIGARSSISPFPPPTIPDLRSEAARVHVGEFERPR